MAEYFASVVARASASRATLFHALKESVSAASRGRVAVRTGAGAAERSLTYGELIEGIEARTDALLDEGLRAGDALGVVMKNSPDFVVTAFAAWHAGAGILPLNPQLRPQELTEQAGEAGARHFAVDDDVRLRLAGDDAGKPVHAVRSDAAEAARDFPSTIQFSTGSTGRPKRVTRTQAHFIGEQEALRRLLGVTADDRILAVTPFFHGYGLMYSVIMPLIAGATVHVLGSFIPGEVARLIERERITGLAGVPFMYELLAAQRKLRDLQSLRYALSGGAPLTQGTAESFRARYGVTVRQAYGSTETGAICVADEILARERFSSVGYPVPGVTLRTVGEDGRALPIEQEGYIEVDSPFAARAYDYDPQSSESCFTEGGFRPGDKGRISGKGDLTLSGRSRGFVNVAGNKVDPREVEDVLREIQDVTEAVVVALDDGAAGERVVAVVETTRALGIEQVRIHCAARLAAYKLPRVIQIRSSLPRSPLGKVLRQNLVDDLRNAHKDSGI